MYKNILVPLDGSQLAECVLPHVESIAKGCGVPTVTFVRVLEPVNWPSAGEFYVSEKQIQQWDEQNRKEAQDYLARIAGRSKYNGIKVKTEVLTGLAADAITDYAAKNNVDLIVIATHGRSGVSRWVWGSVADRILRSACVPVFMVRAPGCVPGI
jgi:nucleotide-binding universal stress UspA family protein